VTANEEVLRHRAERLLRWYPKEWRSRYGEEFTELLIADMEERPQSLRRGADVALNGMVARSAAAGIGGQHLDAADERRSLVALGGALSVFIVFALAIWSQLTIGWQWSQPETPATSWAMLVMSTGIVACGLLCVTSAVPIVWAVARGLTRRTVRGLTRPVLLAVGGIAILIVGTHHFVNGWPGTGGHPWAHQGIVPGGVAAFAWASTLFITSYWAHPSALSAFPTSEVVWMLVSPAALGCVLVGVAKLVRRLDFSPRVLRYERRLAVPAALTMATFLTGAALWVFDGGPGPRNLFHIGAIDIVDFAAMALALTLASRAARRVGPGPMRLSRS